MMKAALAAAAVPPQRRGAIKGSNALHWTETLDAEHATTRLGARFHLRKLFFRDGVDEFSQSELEFIVQYLVNETTIAEQPWWAALTHFERLEIVNSLELVHVPRGEDQTLWFSSKDTAKDCILLYGTAEAKPMDRNLAPVLKFTEGSVVGNMRLSTSLQTSDVVSSSQVSSAAANVWSDVTVSASASAETWRRVKREQAFRNGLQHYNKLLIVGPADYFMLTSATILATTSKAADRQQRQLLLRTFGLERFVGVIRKKTFECGAILAHEDETLRSLYFIIEGECRASVRVDDLVDVDPFAEKKVANSAATAMLLGYKPEPSKSPRKLTQLPIASLGPRSLVGDVSILLGLREPATIQAVTVVTVLALAEEDYIKEVGDLRDPVVAAPIENMKSVAVETMSFVLERVIAESAYHECDQTKKIQSLEQRIASKAPEIRRTTTETNSFAKPAQYQSLPSTRKTPTDTRRPSQYRIPLTQASSSAHVAGKVPSIVQKYVSTVAASRSPRGSESKSALAPVILSKRSQKYTDVLGDDKHSWVTREQRKAAMALNGLHSPLASKSLGQLQRNVVACNRDEDDGEAYGVIDTSSYTSGYEGRADERRQQQVTTPDDQLFLFPTMTRQRQFHARSLPLLPKYRGLELNPR